MSDKKNSPWGGNRPNKGFSKGNASKKNDDGEAGGSASNESSWGEFNNQRSSNFGGGNFGGGNPPEIDDVLQKMQDGIRRLLPGGLNNRLFMLILIVGVSLWAATGIYRVGPAERGVELVFGKYSETTLPGLHYNYPAPIGEVFLPSVDLQRRLNVGFRSQEVGRSSQVPSDIASESIMLTADENIVDLDFTVFWRIGDPRLFLFAVRDPESTLKVVAESAMREVVGQTTFDLAVTRGRDEIEQKTLQVMQDILDSYESGVLVESIELQASDPPSDVIDAFNDVQRARQDRDRLRNEAEAYANSVVPEARGQAERLLREAEAYRERLVQEAKGEAQRFLSVYESYRQAPEITRQRMYLEVLGRIYQTSNKVIIDPDIASEGGQGVVPYLPLNELNRGNNNQSGANQ